MALFGLPAAVADALLGAIPSPTRGVLFLGPLPLRAYALCILLGVAAAVAFAGRRWAARGFDPKQIADLALWVVPAGLIGARLYHVATDYQLYTHDPVGTLRVWDGGLGIWGGVAAGAVTGIWIARRRQMDTLALLDAVAPAIPLAQAIGRWGNWFNQELFGRPTNLPWGLHIDAAHRPDGYVRFSTFQPTFLYEFVWNLAVVALVILVERRGGLKRGRLFAVYVAAYTFGRFWIESLRIDPAHRIGGLRVNDWASVAIFCVAMGFVLTGRTRAGPRDGGEAGGEKPGPGASRRELADRGDSDGDDPGANRSAEAWRRRISGSSLADP